MKLTDKSDPRGVIRAVMVAMGNRGVDEVELQAAQEELRRIDGLTMLHLVREHANVLIPLLNK